MKFKQGVALLAISGCAALGGATSATSVAAVGGTQTAVTSGAAAPNKAKVRTVRIKDPSTGKVAVSKARIVNDKDATGLRRNGGAWMWVWNGVRWVVKWVVRVCTWTACWTYIVW